METSLLRLKLLEEKKKLYNILDLIFEKEKDGSSEEIFLLKTKMDNCLNILSITSDKYFSMFDINNFNYN
jgi:hypothetical protein